MKSEKITYQGKIIEVVEFSPDGKRVFELARRAPGTRTIVRVDGKIILTREHRHEVGGYDYRLPGGKVFDKLSEYNEFLATKPSDDEKLAAARTGAIKELREEVGLSIEEDDLELIYKSVCGATVEWDLYYFAVSATPSQLRAQRLEEGEDISLVQVTLAEAKEIAQVL